MTSSPVHSSEDEIWRLAETISRESNCVRRKVGAVLVSPASVVMSMGFNVERDLLRCDKGECPRGRKTLEEKPRGAPYDDCVAVHAEVIAVSDWLYIDLSECTLYVTEEPCEDCRTYLGLYTGSMRVMVKGKGEMK